MYFQDIACEKHDGITIIRFNRPEGLRQFIARDYPDRCAGAIPRTPGLVWNQTRDARR